MGAGYAGIATMIVHQFSPSMEIVPGILIFLLLWIGFCHAGFWMFIDRPAELRKKFPITGDEVRRGRETFYDWLNSQRRR
jgi:hypothetical protein